MLADSLVLKLDDLLGGQDREQEFRLARFTIDLGISVAQVTLVIKTEHWESLMRLGLGSEFVVDAAELTWMAEHLKPKDAYVLGQLTWIQHAWRNNWRRQ